MFTQPLKKFSVKFQGQKPATSDPTTGAQTPASGPDHGLAEISLESHAPEKKGMTQGASPDPQQFGGGTELSPMESALFPHWMRANGIDPESTTDHTYDYKGAYQNTGGQVHPPGVLSGMADRINKIHSSRTPDIQSLLGLMGGATGGVAPGAMGAQAGPQGVPTPMGAGAGSLDGPDPVQQLMALIGQHGGQ